MPAEAEKMLAKVREQLKDAHPKWDSKRIDSSAYAIVNNYWIKNYGKPAFS